MLHFRIAAFRGRDPDNPSDRKHPSNGRFCQRMEINGGGTTNTLTSVGKDNMVLIRYDQQNPFRATHIAALPSLGGVLHRPYHKILGLGRAP